MAKQKAKGSDWLVGNSLSVADLSLFAYSHKLEEAKLSFGDFPLIRDWVERIQALTHFQPMRAYTSHDVTA